MTFGPNHRFQSTLEIQTLDKEYLRRIPQSRFWHLPQLNVSAFLIRPEIRVFEQLNQLCRRA